MFSIEDIVVCAIQIEKNGERVYRKAADKSSNKDLKSMLIWMADEEAQHLEWFKKLDYTKIIDFNKAEIEKMGRDLLREAIGEDIFSLDEDALLNAEEIDQLVILFIKLEQDTILFYELLSEFIEDDKVGEQLSQIILEEKKHVERLEALMPAPAR